MTLKFQSKQIITPESDLPYLFCQYLLEQFEYSRRLEEGVIAGVEPEYLHQYRVSLRRCRSLTKLLKMLLSPFEFSLMSKHLVTLMKPTNLLRDLDVFLLTQQNYMSEASQHQQAIEDLFQNIKKQRSKEHKRVQDWLTSKNYLAICIILHNSLKRSVSSDFNAEPVETKPFADNQILTHLQKVMKQSKPLNKHSPDSSVHKVRIECKKLRYLMEYFAPLYSDPNHQENVAMLKSLQDKLGDFNDASTQLEHFTQLLQYETDSKQIKNKQHKKALKYLVNSTQECHSATRKSALKQIELFRRFATDGKAYLPYS